jgi:hypothetical protein
MANKIKESNITDSAVTTAKIADNAITSDKIAPGAVVAADVGDGTITTAKIAADAIDGTKIADDAIDSEHITDGSVDNVHLAGSIANDKLTNSSITINGTSIALGASGTIVAGTDWQAVKTADFTAVAGEGYFIDTTSSAITVTLPASPSIGDEVSLVDYGGNSATNKITLNVNGNKILGSSLNKTISTNETGIILVYTDSTKGWVVSGAYIEGTIGIVGVPGAPTIGTATATGNTTATVAFTAPSDNGDDTITSYTATSSPGGITGTLSQAGSGTITVTGLSRWYIIYIYSNSNKLNWYFSC